MVRATHHPSRNPPDKPSLATEQFGRNNVIEYCGQLLRYSLTSGTNTKYMTTIEQCHVNSSPNTLQAILGEL